MPFTPFHFGPHILIALPFRRHVDMVSFVTASIAVDIEPLLVLFFFRFQYPLHGYCHTFLFGAVVGLLWGVICYASRNLIQWGLRPFRLTYETTIAKAAIWGALGASMHILLDAPLYHDIKPFFPWQTNPLYQTVGAGLIYGACLVAFLAAMVAYFRFYRKIGGADANLEH